MITLVIHGLALNCAVHQSDFILAMKSSMFDPIGWAEVSCPNFEFEFLHLKVTAVLAQQRWAVMAKSVGKVPILKWGAGGDYGPS